MPVFYHYTDKKGFEGIQASGVIKKSIQLDDGDDAAFGTGVYLTSVSPDQGKKKIEDTCWGVGSYPRKTNDGRLDYVIVVELPSNKVKKATRKREVYVYLSDLKRSDCISWHGDKVPDKQ